MGLNFVQTDTAGNTQRFGMFGGYDRNQQPRPQGD